VITAIVTDVYQRMDTMYRYQRYFYDATRKFYLLGRDRLIDKMQISAGQTVAEIGCGTGRNLEILARKNPSARFFGLDASSEMLETASNKLQGFENIKLATALADTFDLRTLGLDRPLDAVFFSYSISMIPVWRESIENAIANLRPGGTLFIVDFYDQRDLPRWFQYLLRAWLRRFHVQSWNDLIPFLFKLEADGRGSLEIESVGRRYAFIATFRKAEET
jgi:S-adenosylmethionine-diacylgycerolhomoserine-N-methlytransferase